MSSENQAPENFNEKEWLQKEYANALGYCSINGLVVSNTLQPEHAILPHVVAVWLVEVKENAKRYWVITGDLPNDYILSSSAENPREALTEEWIEKQKTFTKLLVSRAHSLYVLAEKEEYWIKN